MLVLACWAAAAAAPAYSADRQQRFVIQHVTDAATRKSWWSIVDDRAPLPASFESGWAWVKLPFSDGQRWTRPAPPDSAVKAAGIQVVSQSRRGATRTLLLRLTSNGNDDIELIAPADAGIVSAGGEGFVRPIDPAEKGKYHIGCSGRSCDGAVLQLTTAQPEPIKLLVVASRYALPPSAALLLAAKPRFARPQYSPDATITFSRVTL
jgi:hypothetical protein